MNRFQIHRLMEVFTYVGRGGRPLHGPATLQLRERHVRLDAGRHGRLLLGQTGILISNSDVQFVSRILCNEWVKKV